MNFKLIFLCILTSLYSCSGSSLNIPKIDESKFGKIIGVWRKSDSNNRQILYAITDKNVFLETHDSDYTDWRDLDKR